MILISIVAALILCNAIFVAAEFAIVAVPRAWLQSQAEAGNKVALHLLNIVSNPVSQDRYITTAQVGITAASLALGMYGEHMLALWLQTLIHANVPQIIMADLAASIGAVAILTYFHIVLGEMLPKSFALQYARETASVLSAPMAIFSKLFAPIIGLLNGASSGILALMGIERKFSTAALHTVDEIELLVEESTEEGLIRGTSGELIQQLFEFSDLLAEEVMVPRVLMKAIPVTATTDQLRALVTEHPHTRYPVYGTDKDNIIGIIHIKDIAAMLSKPEEMALRVRPVPFVPESSDLQSVMDAMHRARTHMAVVIDEYGGTAGIVSMQDIFEEILGQLRETAAAEDLSSTAENEVVAQGSVRLDEVGEALDIVLEHPEVNTIGGLVVATLKRPPRQGDEIVYEKVQITVTRVEGKRVKQCIVRLLPTS